MNRKSNLTGFTLIELLVVVAIIAVLVAMLLPALQKTRQMARTTVCQSQLRQLGMGIGYYANDYSDFMMSTVVMLQPSEFRPPYVYHQYTRWYDWLRFKYFSGPPEVYFDPKFITTCPEADADDPGLRGYGMNVYGPGGTGYWPLVVDYRRYDEVVPPHSVSVYVTDTANPSYYGSSLQTSHPDYPAAYWAIPSRRHGDSYNVLFVDLHVDNRLFFQPTRDSSHQWNLFGVAGHGL